MYFILVLEAIFNPKRTMKKIACAHEAYVIGFINGGEDKHCYCSKCDADWFVMSGQAA